MRVLLESVYPIKGRRCGWMQSISSITGKTSVWFSGKGRWVLKLALVVANLRSSGEECVAPARELQLHCWQRGVEGWCQLDKDALAVAASPRDSARDILLVKLSFEAMHNRAHLRNARRRLLQKRGAAARTAPVDAPLCAGEQQTSSRSRAGQCKHQQHACGAYSPVGAPRRVGWLKSCKGLVGVPRVRGRAERQHVYKQGGSHELRRH
eukprot:3048717-Prymnesium_polylepis.1